MGSITLIFVLMRTRFGLGLTAVRDNDLGAENLGVNVRFNRFVAFVISGFGCGCAGAVFYMNGFLIDPMAAFDIHWAGAMIFIVIMGGIGTLEGPIKGAALYFALREAFPAGGNWYLIVVGAVSVLVMVKAPRGIWGYLQARYGIQVFPVQRLTQEEFQKRAFPEELVSWMGWMQSYLDPAKPAASPPGGLATEEAAQSPGGWMSWMEGYFRK